MADNKKEQPKPNQINIELGEKEAEGTYSNLAIISHSPAEFILDFTRILPGVPKGRILSRIIMTPQHAKMFLNALTDNMNKFEQQHGPVKVDRPDNIFPGFSGNPKVN